MNNLYRHTQKYYQVESEKHEKADELLITLISYLTPPDKVEHVNRIITLFNSVHKWYS